MTRRRADALPVRWITTVLTLLAIAVHCYRYFTDFVFKIYAFVEQNQKNTLLDDESDPFSFHNLSKMWVGSRFARLCAVTLKMHPGYMFSFLSELLILSVHSPPMTFDTFWSIQASGQSALYTNETFILAFMCIRLYILPRVVRVYVANRYSGAMCGSTLSLSRSISRALPCDCDSTQSLRCLLPCCFYRLHSQPVAGSGSFPSSAKPLLTAK